MTNEAIVSSVISGVVSLTLGVFGKSFWDYKKNKDVVKGQLECKKLIKAKDLEILQLRTNMETILQIFEIEHGKKSKYKELISKVRENNTFQNDKN